MFSCVHIVIGIIYSLDGYNQEFTTNLTELWYICHFSFPPFSNSILARLRQL